MSYLSKWKAKDEESKIKIFNQIYKIIACVLVFMVLLYIFH